MSAYRIGLLGAGYILKSHARAIAAAEGAVLHTVCDLSEARARAAAAEFGAHHVLTSLRDLAASDCDAVHILLPPALHLEAARTLIEAGKHVFIEKPMGLPAAVCEEVAALAEARGVALGVNHNFLFARGYQPIRDDVRSGRLGPVDQLTLNWLYALPLLQFGPFNNWMVARPANLVFELAPHLAAFALDLMGAVEITAAAAANPLDLPGNQRVFRRWNALGRSDTGALSLNLSVAPGQTDRSLHLRTLGGVAHFDLEKGLGWREEQLSDNPIVDNLRGARAVAAAMGGGARRDFLRYFLRALRKRAGANPFEESIAASVAAFYAGIGGTPDPRLTGRFGAAVIRLCEAIVKQAGVEQVGGTRGDATEARAPAPLPPPRVLVIGGTGFIGRRLVERLARRGIGVRVLTRSLASAGVDLAGLPVELMQGSHGDPDRLRVALAGIDTVYHLAKAEGQRWEDYLANDVEPTRRLAEAALAAGVRRFVYTGTIDSYASADPRATITGATPLDPAIATRNLYARSKAACEALLKRLAREQGLPLVIFRPGVVIGAGSPPAHLGVGKFVSPTRVDFWGEGTTALPFVLVDDVADALDRALDLPGIDGEDFLLTDAPLLSARDYVAAVAARSGTRVEARPHPLWRYWAADAAKERLKHAIRHPNRRASTYHDWACRAHRARYDASDTQARLGWQPVGTREELIEHGINAAVDRFMR